MRHYFPIAKMVAEHQYNTKVVIPNMQFISYVSLLRFYILVHNFHVRKKNNNKRKGCIPLVVALLTLIVIKKGNRY